LIAEEVKVNPDLVVRDRKGEEHCKVNKLQAAVAGLTTTVKEQAAQIQKVSTQLEGSKPTPQVVNNP